MHPYVTSLSRSLSLSLTPSPSLSLSLSLFLSRLSNRLTALGSPSITPAPMWGPMGRRPPYMLHLSLSLYLHLHLDLYIYLFCSPLVLRLLLRVAYAACVLSAF